MYEEKKVKDVFSFSLKDLLPPYGSSYFYRFFRDDEPKWAEWLSDNVLKYIDEVYYWFYYRIVRFDIVKLDMGKHYKDVDARMFLACFALLGEFVEKELGPINQDNATWYGADFYKGYRLHSASGSDEKAIDLWLWYLEERKSKEFWSNITDSVEYNLKLTELIEMRCCLWT